MKRFWGIVLWLSCAAAAWPNFHALNLSVLKQYDLIADDVDYLRANVGKFDHWSAQWPYNDSKEQCLGLLKAASLRIEALHEKTPSDVELSLLLMVVYQYRYNLDDNAVVHRFLDLTAATEAQFPDDYRPVWIDALFLMNSGQQVKAVQAFQRILGDRSQLSTVHPALLLDYAQASYLAGMPRTAKISVDAYIRRTGNPQDQVPLAGIINGVLKTSDPNGGYKPDDVWWVSKTESNVRFVSPMLSTAFTVPGDWKPGLRGYANFQSVCVLTPPAITSKQGKLITIHLVLIQSTKDQPFPDFVAALERGLDKDKGYVYSPTEMPLPTSEKTSADQVTNPNLYADRGGMRGYAIFFGNALRDDSGFNLDRPNALPDAGTGPNHYRPVAQYDRFPAGINTALLVDSCQEIADETDAIVKSFLASLQVD